MTTPATRPRIERVNLKLPDGFDETKHTVALRKLIAEKHGSGWEIDSLDLAAGTASASRQVELTQVEQTNTSGRDSIEVRLPRSTKPTDGDRTAAKLENSHEGYTLTMFEPFLGYAVMEKLTPQAIRCRGALAVALSVKPWEVQVSPTVSGGFTFSLPRTYVPSKHDDKLQEVAEAVVGREGWFVKVNPQELTGEIIPSDPPTFPAVVPYPMSSLSKADIMRTPFGMKLPENGKTAGETVYIDWGSSAFGMVAGTPGSGKSVTLNAIIAQQLAAGALLAVCDVPDKKQDFTWMKQWCMDGGWGADSDVQALAVLSLILEEVKRRSKIIESHGVTNWRELPASAALKPILIIVDELSAMLVTERIPAGVPKDNPIVIKKTMTNLVKVSIEDVLTTLLAVARASGVRMIIATQVTNASTGIGPSQKTKIGHKILQGSNPSKTARTQAFSDESGVPDIPGNVRADARVAKGVGAAELEGQAPFIYKSFYASVDDYQAALRSLGVKISSRPEPTAAEIARFDPIDDLADDDGAPASRMRPEVGGYGRNEKRAPRADGLSGAAAAAHDAAVEMAVAKRAAQEDFA